MKTRNSFVYNVENPVDLLYSFRNEYKTKENSIAYDIIYDAILNVSDFGYIPSLNDDKDNLKDIHLCNFQITNEIWNVKNEKNKEKGM